jgi:hypothetical protein
MKRATLLTGFLACGLLATSGVSFAQDVPDKPPAAPKAAYWSNWFNADTTLLVLGHTNVTSSKFQEYREVREGVSMPEFTLQGSHNGRNIALFGQNISQTDQRYFGRASAGWLGVRFNYNQIPHNMGNDGTSITNNTAPGVWSMSATLRQALQTTIQNQPTAGRTWDFYSALYAPTIAAASRIDMVELRKRGTVEFDLGANLPFDLAVTYMRDVKTGTRGQGGGYVRGYIDNIVQIPEGLDEVTQDLGFKALLDRKWGNVHGAVAHNWYIDRVGTTVVDNPVQPFDQVYVAAVGSTPATGGGAQARFINPPSNQADTGSFGALFKFRRQTRVAADVTLSKWTQTAQLYPYTINSAVLTPSGVQANSLSALQFQHLDGKIDTTTLNLSFTSRPAKGLGLRARYRSYDLSNKTPAIPRVGYVSLDRAWTSATITADQPLGYPTADPYGMSTGRFDVSASYDVKALTFDAGYHYTRRDWTYREATEGTENGVLLSAVLHSRNWLLFRGHFEDAKRTAKGFDAATDIGLQVDQADRDSTRAGIDVELTPNDKVGFVLAYLRRHDDFPDRPNRVPGVSNTANGLLKANYDSYTAEIDLTPSARGNVSFYYTWEKNLSTTQTGATSVLNILNFAGSDKTNTFGLNGSLVLVPNRWTFNVDARRQKLDALMDVTGDPNGSFAIARASLGGIKDITDYGDTEYTTASARLSFHPATALTFSAGYAYEKYVYLDAFSWGLLVYPQVNTGFYLKADDRSYNVNIVFANMTYRF